MLDYAKIWDNALEASRKAASEFDATLPPENKRGFDCGFAWVQVTPGNHPFVKWAKTNSHGSKHWDKGWYFSGSSLHDVRTQSIDTNRAAASAFATYLREALKNDTRAAFMVGSRYD